MPCIRTQPTRDRWFMSWRPLRKHNAATRQVFCNGEDIGSQVTAGPTSLKTAHCHIRYDVSNPGRATVINSREAALLPILDLRGQGEETLHDRELDLVNYPLFRQVKLATIGFVPRQEVSSYQKSKIACLPGIGVPVP